MTYILFLSTKTLEEMLSLAALISASTENGTISETHQAAQCSHSAV